MSGPGTSVGAGPGTADGQRRSRTGGGRPRASCLHAAQRPAPPGRPKPLSHAGRKVASVGPVTTLHSARPTCSRTVLRSEPAVLVELGRCRAAAGPDRRAGAPRGVADPYPGALRPEMRPYLDLCRTADLVPDLAYPARLRRGWTAAGRGRRHPGRRARRGARPRWSPVRCRARVGAASRRGTTPRRAPTAGGDGRLPRRRARRVLVGDEGAVRADRAVRGQHAGAGLDRVFRGLSPYLAWARRGSTTRCRTGARSPDDVGYVAAAAGACTLAALVISPRSPACSPTRAARWCWSTRSGRCGVSWPPASHCAHLLRPDPGGRAGRRPPTAPARHSWPDGSASRRRPPASTPATLRGRVDQPRSGPVAVVRTLTPLGEQVLRAGRPGDGVRSAGDAVDAFADQVGVAVVPGVLLDHVHVHPAQR